MAIDDEFGDEESFEDEENFEDEGEDSGEDEDSEDDGVSGEDEENFEDEEVEGDEEGSLEDEGSEAAFEGEEAWGDDEFDLPPVDEDTYYSRDQWPDATDEDWEDDTGDWSEQDYEENSRALFGWREDFGRTSHDAYLAEGYVFSEDGDRWGRELDSYLGGGCSGMRLYEKDGAFVPMGFLTAGALAAMALLYPAMDLSRLHVTVPRRPEEGLEGYQSRPLPDELRNVNPADAVDLRKYCSPVGDQGQTSRCAAFAWTHAVEMLGNIQGRPVPPLSCSYTMLRFQQRQGDAKDYAWAWKGGEGTIGTWEPGKHIFEQGICQQELWPNDEKQPRVSASDLEADAKNFVFPGETYDITVDDMKALLTRGLPVQISMATGPAFEDIGSDGVMKVAEKPSGDHGYHAMLCVGYVGNYFIIKNSWGEEWGDRGYCYVPKKVLMDAEPEPVAIVPLKPMAPADGASAEGPRATVPVKCGYCGGRTPPGAKCSQCGGPLRKTLTCAMCGAELLSGVVCGTCGARHG